MEQYPEVIVLAGATKKPCVYLHLHQNSMSITTKNANTSLSLYHKISFMHNFTARIDHAYILMPCDPVDSVTITSPPVHIWSVLFVQNVMPASFMIPALAKTVDKIGC